MKKILLLQLFTSASLLAGFNACSGGGSNNLPPPAFESAGSQAGLTSGCGSTGINSEMSCQTYETTADKRTEFQKYCTGRSGAAELCHVQLKGAEVFTADASENGQQVNGGVLPILNPNTQTGGLPTGITVYPGDMLTIRMADGHYSTHPSNGHCSDDISVEGNQVVEGEDTLINNPQNGLPAGAYIELMDASGFQPVGRTAVKIPVPQNGSQSNPLSVLIGFNAQTMSCGEIKVSYQIKRCLDTALNTYDCGRL
jgi:hypothetical protein